MVLFRVKWSQRGVCFDHTESAERLRMKEELRVGGESWGPGQATHPEPGCRVRLRYQGFPTLWTASGMRDLCLTWALSHPFRHAASLCLNCRLGRGRQRWWCDSVAQAASQWEQKAAFTQDKGLVVYLPISRSGSSVNFTASIGNWEEVNYIIHTTTWRVHAC